MKYSVKHGAVRSYVVDENGKELETNGSILAPKVLCDALNAAYAAGLADARKQTPDEYEKVTQRALNAFSLDHGTAEVGMRAALDAVGHRALLEYAEADISSHGERPTVTQIAAAIDAIAKCRRTT